MVQKPRGGTKRRPNHVSFYVPKRFYDRLGAVADAHYEGNRSLAARQLLEPLLFPEDAPKSKAG